MDIISFTSPQFTEFLSLVDDEIRPPGVSTHAWEDFPLILGPGNREMILGICEGGRVVAGVGCLVRQFQTSCGPIPVAGVGSVVTRPEFRGRGFSRALQNELIHRLGVANVPLAVLWTDRPEIYRGRGFASAGWEFHVDMEPMRVGGAFPERFTFRTFGAADVSTIADLYDRHPFRTLRNPGDAELLYTMPGTRGLVATGEGGQVVAAVFCGKGADFPDYVVEWSGPLGLVIPLLEEVRHRKWARHLLAPPGGDRLADQLARLGATVVARETGLWKVIQPDGLSRYLQGAGHGASLDSGDPASVLGSVGPDGVIIPGVLTVAVWGFDSV